jgi:GT2 family glycosyltransferase
MSERQPKVNIIILQYNNSVDTLDCLWSLKNTTYSNFDVVIVDNASREEEVEKIKDYIEEGIDKFDIHLIETGANLGYAGGNNIGMEYSFKNGAEYVFVLNNDTVVAPDFLDRLLEKADEYGIVGPKMNYYRYGPGEDEIWFSGADVKFLDTNIQHSTEQFKDTRDL